MSDEEKKAIEYLKNRLEILHNNTQWATENSIKIVLNLIEKQFKEIEELKANKGYHLGFIDGGIAKRYEYEDKIKAKIEDVSNGTYDAKIVLESLLEKENENKWKMKK